MRWYDEHEELGKHIDSFKEMEQDQRDKIVSGVLAILKEEDPDVTSLGSALDFPLTINRRRWYDQDPYLWLAVNGLERASPATLERVVSFLNEKNPQ